LKNQGRLKLRSLVIEAHNIEGRLRYLGEPLEPPKRAPARGPPHFKSKVLRRKFGELRPRRRTRNDKAEITPDTTTAVAAGMSNQCNSSPIQR